MCSIPAFSLAVSVLGIGVSIDAQNKQADYNEQVAKNNATIAEYKAQDALERGTLAEKQKRLQTQQLIAKQKVGIAGSGFTIGEGSAADMIVDTAALGEEDVFAIRSNAAREAWSFRVTGTNELAEAGLAQTKARNQNIQTILSGSSSVADKWYKYDDQGAFD